MRVGKLILVICFLAGAAAGLAGMIEVAAVQGRANANLAAGYGFTGILVAFLARQNPLAIIPVAILLGGIGASGGLLQRRLGLPDASVLVLQGMIFVMVLASDTLYGRFGFSEGKGDLNMAAPGDIGLWTVPLAVLGGAMRVSTPFLFVSLGECITEKQRPHQSRPRRHAGDGRDGRLRRLLSHRLAVARRARRRRGRRAARRAARGDLRLAARQRHRRRHRA